MKAATLRPDLLYRKGEARPTAVAAAVPQRSPEAANRPESAATRFDRPAVVRTPSVQEVPAPDERPDADDATPTDRLVKISVRLDPERHHSLRLFAAHAGQSLQQIAIAALDNYVRERARAVVGKSCDCVARPWAEPEAK